MCIRDRIGTARAFVVGSTVWPAWTARVSGRRAGAFLSDTVISWDWPPSGGCVTRPVVGPGEPWGGAVAMAATRRVVRRNKEPRLLHGDRGPGTDPRSGYLLYEPE